MMLLYFYFIAGDSLSHHNNQRFTTKDSDNDQWSGNCAITFTGAWWYRYCHRSNLNGMYFRDGQVNPEGIAWRSWKNTYYSLKAVQMKIRPNTIN